MDSQTGLTHFDEQGQAIMVDVSGKQEPRAQPSQLAASP